MTSSQREKIKRIVTVWSIISGLTFMMLGFQNCSDSNSPSFSSVTDPSQPADDIDDSEGDSGLDGSDLESEIENEPETETGEETEGGTEPGTETGVGGGGPEEGESPGSPEVVQPKSCPKRLNRQLAGLEKQYANTLESNKGFNRTQRRVMRIHRRLSKINSLVEGPCSQAVTPLEPLSPEGEEAFRVCTELHSALTDKLQALYDRRVNALEERIEKRLARGLDPSRYENKLMLTHERMAEAQKILADPALCEAAHRLRL
ncbi:MAG: hypothetical protein H6624_08930 [Bdellovibrionaceae bacterium]|nr:hypothetical protein [Bdellovibrionales bacterium]MCB9084457.1 hypothetical protein [Pseudobdellovibrionaceae bacterium]